MDKDTQVDTSPAPKAVDREAVGSLPERGEEYPHNMVEARALIETLLYNYQALLAEKKLLVEVAEAVNEYWENNDRSDCDCRYCTALKHALTAAQHLLPTPNDGRKL
jgi:hypothetical protein